jgi:hypothetical protein
MANNYTDYKYGQQPASNLPVQSGLYQPQSNTDTLSTSIVSDLGLASLLAAFLAPAIVPIMGVPLVGALAAETALGSTGAGIELLYPQAYQQITKYVPTIPATSVALVLLGMTSLTVGVYMEYYQKNKKRGKKNGNE